MKSTLEYDNLTEIGRGSFATVYKATRSHTLYSTGYSSHRDSSSTSNQEMERADSNNKERAESSNRYPSFSAVIKAGQVIAIKVVNRKKLNRKLQENLDMEIQILKKAKHGNVVTLYHVIKSETEISLVMEYCALGDLSLFIKKKGQVPGMNQSITISGPWGGLDHFVLRYLLAQLASAIEFLRFHHIIHRDLKPQNILLTLSDLPQSDLQFKSLTEQKIALLPILKLADFGFARSLEAESMASTLCGSPLYMAPEILNGEKYDAKTDLWSVGAILFEMVTGKPPFRAQNHIELLRKIERGDGWIRFPDEGPDAFNESYQTREFHGIPIRQQPSGSLGYRKSMTPVMYGASLGGTRIGSLGSSPSKAPIPDDLKNLVRRLLKRNPIERMSFEEFFICPTVIESRSMDPRLMESPQKVSQNDGSSSNVLSKTFESGVKSILSTRSSSNSSFVSSKPPSEQVVEKSLSPSNHLIPPFENLKLQIKTSVTDANEILPPFPSYGFDPNWTQKVFEKTTSLVASPKIPSSPANLKLQSEIKFDMKEPVLPPTYYKFPVGADELGSQNSLGSSVGSIEFSSDEEENSLKKESKISQTQKENEKEAEMTSPREEADDFVVVEKGNVEVKWISNFENVKTTPVTIPSNSSNLVSSNSKVLPGTSAAPISSWSHPFQTISKALSSSLIYGSSLSGKSGSPSSLEAKVVSHPKGRLFGSLRADNSFMPTNHVHNHIPSLEPSLLTDALPFKLDLSNLSPSNRNTIVQISVYISRAFCISSLADQQWDELESDSGSLVIGSTDSKSRQWNSLANDALQLLIFAVGLYQYSMNQAKDFWKAGPAITREGYSFSSSPPDNQQNYLSHLSTLINFIQVQFNLYLDRADRLQKSLSSSPAEELDSQMTRSPQRIIYGAAISTCKRGALAEMTEGGGEGFYKTSILLLHSILQPSWEEKATGIQMEGKLEEEEQKEVQALLDQINIRMYALCPSTTSLS